jgi:hypothetical protein
MNIIDELVERSLIPKPGTTPIERPSRAKLEGEAAKYNLELDRLSLSKPELIVPVVAKIEKILFSGQANNSFCPSSEMVMGGRSPSYPIGDYYSCAISIEGDRVIRTVDFLGWPSLERGNIIRAHIFAGEKRGKKYVTEAPFGEFVIRECGEDREGVFYRMLPPVANPFVWIRRDLKSSESAVQLEKLNAQNEVVASWVDSRRMQEINS